MPEFIKHLFCFHCWKEVKREYLGIEKQYCDYVETGYDSFATYTVYKECIKCGKVTIVKQAELVE